MDPAEQAIQAAKKALRSHSSVADGLEPYLLQNIATFNDKFLVSFICKLALDVLSAKVKCDNYSYRVNELAVDNTSTPRSLRVNIPVVVSEKSSKSSDKFSKLSKRSNNVIQSWQRDMQKVFLSAKELDRDTSIKSLQTLCCSSLVRLLDMKTTYEMNLMAPGTVKNDWDIHGGQKTLTTLVINEFFDMTRRTDTNGSTSLRDLSSLKDFLSIINNNDVKASLLSNAPVEAATNMKSTIPNYNTSVYYALVRKCLTFFCKLLPFVSYGLYEEHCRIHRQELAMKITVQEYKNKKVVDMTEDIQSTLTQESTADMKTLNSLIDSKVVAKIDKKFDELKSILSSTTSSSKGKGKQSSKYSSSSSSNTSNKTPHKNISFDNQHSRSNKRRRSPSGGPGRNGG